MGAVPGQAVQQAETSVGGNGAAPQSHQFNGPGSSSSAPIHFTATVTVGVVLLAILLGMACWPAGGRGDGWRDWVQP